MVLPVDPDLRQAIERIYIAPSMRSSTAIVVGFAWLAVPVQTDDGWVRLQ
jgi:hypothetical protein